MEDHAEATAINQAATQIRRPVHGFLGAAMPIVITNQRMREMPVHAPDFHTADGMQAGNDTVNSMALAHANINTPIIWIKIIILPMIVRQETATILGLPLPQLLPLHVPRTTIIIR